MSRPGGKGPLSTTLRLGASASFTAGEVLELALIPGLSPRLAAKIAAMSAKVDAVRAERERLAGHAARWARAEAQRASARASSPWHGRAVVPKRSRGVQ